MITAAGVLFLYQGKVLLVQRSDQGDMPGTWALPGGKVEPGETLDEAVTRECREELGTMPAGKRTPFDFSDDGSVAYTTFIQSCDQFNPTLNDEHTGFTWATLGDYPQPLHPGVAATIEKLTMNEMDVAIGIRDGRFQSPSRFYNVSMFAMRITGTGTAYRSSINEHVYRPPENYLTPDFLARCNGLPVIWTHPAKASLDSQTFVDTIVGAVCLPYLVGDEVWGIVKVYDDDAIQQLTSGQLSTSPTVVFSHPAINSTVDLDGGGTLLIEGDPALLDHLAICEAGVWDKGGSPVGVRTTINQEAAMPDKTPEEIRKEEEAEAAKADKARKDAEAKIKADAEKDDKLAKFMDSMTKFADGVTKRLDSLEAVKTTPEETAEGKAKADAARKDAEEKEKKEREDKARKDAENEEKAERERREKADADVKARLEKLEGERPTEMADAERAEMADAQARCDSVAQVFGQHAPRPMQGERPLGYRKRLVAMFKAHSPAWKDIDLSGISDAAMLGPIERTIYADAEAVGRSPASAPAGHLRAIVKRDVTGRNITEFVGHPDACFSPWKVPAQRVKFTHNRQGA